LAPASAYCFWAARCGYATSAAPSDSAPTKKQKIDPFSDWDWSWLNVTAHQEPAFDSKFFTPGNPGRYFLHLRFQQTSGQFDGRVERNISLEQIQLEQLGVGATSTSTMFVRD